MITQKELVQRVVYRLSFQAETPVVEVKAALDEALRVDIEEYDGQVFHRIPTPRHSARRALYEALDSTALLIRDGRGILRFRSELLGNVILQGDAWNIIKLLPDGVVDFIVSDAPSTHLRQHRRRGQTTRLTTNSFFEERDLDGEILREFYRVLKPGSYCALYMPGLQATAHTIWESVLRSVRLAGFVTVRDVPWIKQRVMGYRWTSTHEPVLCLAKLTLRGALPPCMDRSASSVIIAPAPRGNNRTPYFDYTVDDYLEMQALLDRYGSAKKIPRDVRAALKGRFHDTEKPVEVARHLLRVGRVEGGLVLEVFAGTGHACAVAHEFGMRYLAIELSPRTVYWCLAQRLRDSLQGIVEVRT